MVALDQHRRELYAFQIQPAIRRKTRKQRPIGVILAILATLMWPQNMLAELVIRHRWLQEGRSTLHRFSEPPDCKDKTSADLDIKIAEFGRSVTNFV